MVQTVVLFEWHWRVWHILDAGIKYNMAYNRSLVVLQRVVIISISWAKRIISPSIQKANDPILQSEGPFTEISFKTFSIIYEFERKIRLWVSFGEGQLLVKSVTLKGRVDVSPPLQALHQGILRGKGNTSLWTFPALSCIMQFTKVKGSTFSLYACDSLLGHVL